MLKIEDIARAGGTLGELNPDKLIPLPAPYNKVSDLPKRKQVDPRYEASLDGFSALGFSAPKSAEGEEKFVSAFLSGIEKLLSPDNNWPFLKQLQLSMDHCARCQTCVEACPVYVGSGREEVYRPTFRSEVFRRLIKQHSSGKLLARLKGEAIEVNAATLCRLLESAYRCTLCRRCAQTCPMGVDNALLTREIRKLFSMELGIAPKEIHDKGSMLQLRTGSSTGMKAAAVRDNIEFLDDEIREQTGLHIQTPWDKEGADVLLIHNAGEILAWPENPMAFAIILETAGISWTMSSELDGLRQRQLRAVV